MTNYAGQAVVGRDRFDRLGTSVTEAGDLNGDGFADYAVAAVGESAFNESESFSGAVYVIFGDAEGPATLNVADLDGSNGYRVIAGGTPGSFDRPSGIGTHLSGVGDVNGDGIDDMLIGAYTSRYGSYYGATQRETEFFILFGSTDPITPEAGLTVDVVNGPAGTAAEIIGVDGLVANAGSAGDINGDGLNDIIFGQSPVPGSVGGGIFPQNVQAGGDYNGFVILGEAGLGAGGAISITDLDGSNGFGIAGPRGVTIGGVEGGIYAGSYGGFAIGIGDVNGDGFDDIFVQNVLGEVDPSNQYYDLVQFTTTQYILFGRDDSATPFADVIDPAVSGASVDWPNLEFDLPFFVGQPTEVALRAAPQGFSNEGQTYAIAGIGDVNGDGFDDVAIGQSNLQATGTPANPNENEFFTGPVHVLFGGPNGIDNNANDGASDGLPGSVPREGPVEAGAGFTLIESADLGSFGNVIAAVGDVDGDGTDDFVVGAVGPRFDSTQPDQAYLILGRDVDGGDAPFDPLIDVSDLDQTTEAPGVYRFIGDGNTELGAAISAAGDVNNDGIDDFLLGAPETDGAGNDDSIGTAFLVKGGLANLEAADNADGSDDNVIDVANLDVDVATGLVAIDVDIVDGFGFAVLQNEGDAGTTNFDFTVNRTGDVSLGLTLDFAVTGSGFRAADAADFVGGTLPSGQVIFAPGDATATISVPVQGDTVIESDEEFRLQLSNAVISGTATPPPVNLIDPVAFGLIDNDDFAPEIRVTRSSVSNVEGDPGDPGTPRTITFTIERVGDTSGDLDVIYELTPGTNTFRPLLNADDADVLGGLSNGPQTASFTPGQSRFDVVVEISPDVAQEPREQFNFEILDFVDPNNVGYTLGRTTSTGFIVNDDGRPLVIPDGGEADVYGDPHIVTLDGLGYDFQAVGEYILVETDPSNAAVVNPFQVQVRFEPLEDSELVSVTTKMAIQINGTTVEIDARGPDELIIGGVPVADPLAIAGTTDLDGDNLDDVLFDGNTYTVVFNTTENGENEFLTIKVMDGLLNVCVFLSDDAGGNSGLVQGLMGNNDGGFDDDFALRDGDITAVTDSTGAPVLTTTGGVPMLTFDFLYGQGEFDGAGYAGSWAVDAAERLFSDMAPAFPDNFPAGVVSLDTLPADVVAAAEQAARDAGLDPTDEAVFNSAVLDFALTGDDDFFEGALGLAADPLAETAPDPESTPDLPTSYAVTPEVGAVDEGNAGEETTVNFQVFRFGDALGAATVDLSFAGVDMDDVAAGETLTRTVNFAEGDASQVVSLIIAGDNDVEPDEELVLTIDTVTDANPFLIAGASAETLILNDDEEAVNEPPVAVDDDATTSEDVSVTIDLLTNDEDLEEDSLTVTIESDPASGTLTDLGDGVFSYDPNDDFFGQDSFTYSVTDGNGNTSNTATVSIDVASVNDRPAIEAPTGLLGATEDTALPIMGVSVSDVDDTETTVDLSVANGDLTATAVGAAMVLTPPNTMAVVTITGSIADVNATLATLTYSPDPNYNGPDQLVINAQDDEAAGADTVTVDIDVAAVNDAPEVVPVEASFESDAALLVVNLLAGASDIDGDDLDVSDVMAVGMAPTFMVDDEEGLLTIDAGQFEDLAEGEQRIIELTFNVTDGTDATPNTAIITISGAAEPPEGIVVDTLDDVVDANDGLTSLREAVAQANAAEGSDTIVIDVPMPAATNGLTTNVVAVGPMINLTGGALEVSDDLTILGGGVVLDAGMNSRIFKIDNDTMLSLDDMTLTNGLAAGRLDGGAIFGRNGITLEMTDVHLTGNQADDGGAVFLLDNTTFSMVGGSVSDNSGDLGGAIFIDDDSTASFDDVSISGNTGRAGGALRIDAGAVVTIENSEITNNSATVNGGFMFAGDNLDLTMIDTVVDSNMTTGTAGRGGFLRADDDAVIQITGGSISNGAASRGAVLALDDGADVTLTETELSMNVASRFGGGILVDDDGSITLDGATLSMNSAGRLGGGIFMDDDGEVTVSNSSVTGNEAGQRGGAIYGDDRATINVEAGSDLNENTADREGGAVFVDMDGNIMVSDSTVNANSAGQGGAFALDDNGAIMITESTVNDNAATGVQGDGGAIYVDNGMATIALVGTSAAGNSAGDDGGLIGTESARGAVLDISITSDGSDSLTANTAVDDGGLIAVDDDTMIFVEDIAIDGNMAGDDGGVFSVDDRANIRATFVDGGTNAATGDGDILDAGDALDAVINGVVLMGDDQIL